MNYILLHWNFGKESTRMIVQNMQETCNLLLKKKSGEWVEESQGGVLWRPVGTKENSLLEILENDANRIINWGNRIFSTDRFFAANRPSFIDNASNKARCRRILQDASVSVPRTYFWENLEECTEVTYPIIVRPSSHHGGSDFNVFNNPDKLAAFLWGKPVGTWYASEVFEKTHEYRLHVMSGKVSVIQEKPLVEGEIRGNYAVNHESWRILKWGEYNHPMCRTAVHALAILGLDFGAVDMLYNAKNNTWAICEVNTSPAVNSPYMSGKYAMYFDWLIRHDFPEPASWEDENVTFYTKLLRE